MGQSFGVNSIKHAPDDEDDLAVRSRKLDEEIMLLDLELIALEERLRQRAEQNAKNEMTIINGVISGVGVFFSFKYFKRAILISEFQQCTDADAYIKDTLATRAGYRCENFLQADLHCGFISVRKCKRRVAGFLLLPIGCFVYSRYRRWKVANNK